jgi:hypothetical protein
LNDSTSCVEKAFCNGLEAAWNYKHTVQLGKYFNVSAVMLAGLPACHADLLLCCLAAAPLACCSCSGLMTVCGIPCALSASTQAAAQQSEFLTSNQFSCT